MEEPRNKLVYLILWRRQGLIVEPTIEVLQKLSVVPGLWIFFNQALNGPSLVVGQAIWILNKALNVSLIAWVHRSLPCHRKASAENALASVTLAHRGRVFSPDVCD
ncbi:hypothetical protein [Salinibacter ruber]|uniref:hypothetical protein n=1 Tax=Salinibacter ruber TaxID=146919 RepID=UPI002167D7EE|nr:hypothetical protein [Salinibacter ruber]